jgi:hypothetical protein
MTTTSPHDATERLTDVFKQGPLQRWSRDDIVKYSPMRFAQAYLMMAEAGYRPAAPSDGFGHIQLTATQLADRQRLDQEAVKYAVAFVREEDNRTFNVGCSNYTTNRAFVLCIEAARLLCGGGDQEAVRLLKLAIKEIEAESHAVSQPKATGRCPVCGSRRAACPTLAAATRNVGMWCPLLEKALNKAPPRVAP